MTLEDRLRHTLAAEAAATHVSDDAWARVQARIGRQGHRPRRAFAVAGAVPLAIVAVVVAVSFIGNDDASKQVVTGPAAEGTATSGPSSANPGGVAGGSGASAERCAALPSDGPAADQALERFFAARIGRDWAAAQPFITERFASDIGGRDGFIGASSPHVDRFTVFGDLERTAERVRICARTYESTSADRSYSDDSLMLLRSGDGKWRVDEWRRGKIVPMADATEVSVWFIAPDEYCGTVPSEQVRAVVPVPTGPDTARQAIEELLSGPVGRTAPEAAARTALPLDARIRSLSIDNGVARLDLTDAADKGGGACLQSARPEQARRTLLGLPGVHDAQVTAGGRPVDESFQP